MQERNCAPKEDRISLSATNTPRILITRPLPQGRRTADKILALGYEPILAPMLRIVPVSPSASPDFATAQAVLLTSSNGVDALVRLTDLRGIKVLAVGDRTADAACRAGFDRVQSASGDGKALLAMAVSTLSASGGPILHIRGRDAAFSFESLGNDGFTVEQIIGYEAQKIETLPSDAIDPSPNAALIYSARTAEALFSAIEQSSLDPRKVTFIGISKAAIAPFSGVNVSLVVAKSPDEASLLQALCSAVPVPSKK